MPAIGGTPFHPHWLAVAPFFALAEVFVVHLEFRREAHSFSLSEIPLVVGLFFLAPAGLLLAHMFGAGLALVFHRRQSLLKLCFNLAQFALGTNVATLSYRALYPGHLCPQAWGAAFVATLAASAASVLVIAVAISLSEGRVSIPRLRETAVFTLVGTVTNTSVGLIAVSVMWREPISGLLLLVPSIALVLAYHSYTAERAKHETLNFLYQSARMMQKSNDIESMILSLLTQARDVFRAEIAELILFPPTEGEASHRTMIGANDVAEIMSDVILRPDELGLDVDGGRHSVLFGRSTQTLPLYFNDRDLRDGMVVLLQGETRSIGAVVVANRLGDVGAFERADQQLLETLANHAATALENGRLERSLAQLTVLEDALRHQAFHDPLTGLANRALFAERVAAALSPSEAHGPSVAVMFIDLDDFKTVNDSLGHAAGDALLLAVAQRIPACLRADDLPSRLGGDEFAVLLTSVESEDEPAIVAAKVIEALAAPLLVEGETVHVGASIGVAIARPGSMSADQLLGNADVAMYAAKMNGKGGVQTFACDMQQAVLRRHFLKSELQRAVEQQEFVLRYQPMVELSSGDIVGAEALVRWQHPERGLIPPSEFIPLAEETSLILPIGRLVLQQACQQAKRWQERFPSERAFSISVNVSPRQLDDTYFVDHVVRTLQMTGLDPHSLLLEITEGAMMQDFDSSVDKLHQLKSIGVRVAIDDFGTGYSSLRQLRRLPVDVLKIPKEFVDNVVSTESDAAYASAVIRLAQALQMRVVAEGIELPEQLRDLRELDCDFGQGYLFARPLEEADMRAALSASQETTDWPIYLALLPDEIGSRERSS